ncbi:MAG: DUF2723 domain-containing protein [Elusimicrobiota bacterium]
METWAVFVVLAGVYRWGRCPSFGAGDSPRVVYKALIEPGLDPLARLGSLAAKLPGDTAWGHINALSGLFHAAAAALFFAALRRVGVGRVPALIATALLAFSRRYWYYALVAGRGPVSVFGLALLIWALLAWSEEDKPRYLLLCALGAALACAFGYRATSLMPSCLWMALFIGGLFLQRLGPKPQAAALAAALVIPLARPYDLRHHNPTLEYARAVIAGAEPGSRLFVSGPTIEQAVKLVAPAGYDVVRVNSDESALTEGQDPPGRPYYFEAVLPGGGVPRGLLIPLNESSQPTSQEIARRAEGVLALPALSSVGQRDLPKYGFTEEAILYDRYRAVLTRYRERLSADQGALRARLDAQLREYVVTGK